MTRTELEELIRTFTQDAKSYLNEDWPGTPAVLKRDELITALIDDQVYEISTYAPVYKITDITTTATALYRCSTALTSWAEGWSTIERVVYPYDVTVEVPDPLDPDDDYIVEKRLWAGTAADTLVLISTTPTAGETIRVLYTVLQTLTGTITLSDEHVDAFAYLIAGNYLEVVAAEALQHIDGTVSADLVAPTSPVAEIKTLAKNYFENYYRHFGIDPTTQISGASAIQKWDLSKKPRYYWYHK